LNYVTFVSWLEQEPLPFDFTPLHVLVAVIGPEFEINFLPSNAQPCPKFQLRKSHEGVLQGVYVATTYII